MMFLHEQHNSERLGSHICKVVQDWNIHDVSIRFHPTTAPLARSGSWLNALGDGSNGQYDALLGHLHGWTMDVYDYFHVAFLQKGDWEQACRYMQIRS